MENNWEKSILGEGAACANALAWEPAGCLLERARVAWEEEGMRLHRSARGAGILLACCGPKLGTLLNILHARNWYPAKISVVLRLRILSLE